MDERKIVKKVVSDPVAIGVQLERVALDRLAEQSLESAMVLVVLVNALALIAPADDMEQRAGKMYARAPCHVSF